VANLDRRDVSAHRGIPTTTATRTVWDLATALSPLGTRRAFEQAEKLRLLDRERLAALREAAPNRKGAGVTATTIATPCSAAPATWCAATDRPRRGREPPSRLSCARFSPSGVHERLLGY